MHAFVRAADSIKPSINPPSPVSGNKLTGTLPAKVFSAPNMTIFAAGENCLHGEIPDAICSATKLEKLMLYAMSLGCSSSSRMTGSVPSCLFAMPNIRSLYLSSNNLPGSLPNDILTSSPHLVNISVSYNKMEGTIPEKLMRLQLSVLDLANNKFTGVLSDGINGTNKEMDAVEKTALSMKVNRLSGAIPYRTSASYSSVELLAGSLFGCGGEVPQNDPGKGTFSCGSSELDDSIYFLVVGGVVGLAFACFATTKSRQHIASWFKPREGTVPKAIFDAFEGLSTWHASLSLVPSDCVNTLSFIRCMRMMKWLTLLTATVVIGMSIVIYPSLKSSEANSSHYVQYNWYISLAFLKGSGSAAAILILWAFVVTLAVSAIYYYHMTVRADRSDSYRIGPKEQQMTGGDIVKRCVAQSHTIIIKMN